MEQEDGLIGEVEDKKNDKKVFAILMWDAVRGSHTINEVENAVFGEGYDKRRADHLMAGL